MALTVNQEVNGKYGKGVIAAIITKSTGYVLVNYACGKVAKEMAFNLTDAEGNALRKKPGERRASPKEIMYNKIDMIKSALLSRAENGSTSFANTFAHLMEADKMTDNFAYAVCQTVARYRRMSEKQAYVIARYVAENDPKCELYTDIINGRF